VHTLTKGDFRWCDCWCFFLGHCASNQRPL